MAHASSDLLGFDYAQKNEQIDLAKAGDAEAFYQLGLRHYQGGNSSKNIKVAERFFFYSAQKNHTGAKYYLKKIQASQPKAQKVNASSPTNTKIIHKSKPMQKSKSAALTNKIAKNTSKPRPEYKLFSDPNSPEVKVLTANAVNSTTIKPANVKTLGLSTQINKDITLASKHNEIGSPAPTIHLNALKTDIPTRGRVPIYVKTTISLLLIALTGLLAFSYFMTGKLKFGFVPDDFSDSYYLYFNPDVKDAGMNPRKHYIRHGQFEGRRYK